jgi:hypothetical protein
MRYRQIKELEQRLRGILLCSGDVEPEMVAAYIRSVSKSGSHGVMKEVFDAFDSLAQDLPSEYVDFALEFLIEKPEEEVESDPWEMSASRLDDHELGIEGHYEFYPTSPLRGPFLRLLRENEDQGLRLIQTLANTAARNWRAREQKQRHGDSRSTLTPLPVTINLPSGPREFWGDDEVYRWFRPNATGPEAVMCAVMALELWMEQQIEQGRDPDTLFERILSGSECVAILGVCVSVALANPQACLRAVLPLAISPAIWRMDIRRYTGDLMGSFGGDPFGRNRHLFELQVKRDRLPQRRMEVRHLGTFYLFGGDESLGKAFAEGVTSFIDNLPFMYEEMRQDPKAIAWLKKDMQFFQSFGDRNNYHFLKTERGTEVSVRQPQALIDQNSEELSAMAERNLWMRLNSWAHQSIEAGVAANGLSIEEAISAAQKIQRTDDFHTPYLNDGGSVENWRLKAIAGVAAASLSVDFDRVIELGRLDWCRGVLLAAARMLEKGHLLDSRKGGLLDDPKVYAARGLGAFVTHTSADFEIREMLLRLVAETHYNVIAAVFAGLQNAWETDEVLCWNALSMGLSLCLRPRKIQVTFYSAERGAVEAKWVDRVLQTHIKNLKTNVVPPIPRIRASKVFHLLRDLAAQIIERLPIAILLNDTDGREKILQLVDDLVSWTIAKHKPEKDGNESQNRHYNEHRRNVLHLWEWNKFLFSWLSRLSSQISSELGSKHIFEPIRAVWTDAPRLTVDLLQYYFFTNIAVRGGPSVNAQHEWLEMCYGVLDDLYAMRNDRHWDEDESEAASVIIFVRHNMALFDEGWEYVTLFTDVIDRWIDVVKRNASFYSHLLIMLSQARKSFFPEPALEWLNRFLAASPHVKELLREHQNGERTAELLELVWKQAEVQIRGDKPTLQGYSWLVDQLVPLGIPLASLLQQKLEQRG